MKRVKLELLVLEWPQRKKSNATEEQGRKEKGTPNSLQIFLLVGIKDWPLPGPASSKFHL